MSTAKKAGIKPFPKNCLRHSFSSNVVAVHGLTCVAEQAGHSEVMLKKHSREVVTKEDAEAISRSALETGSNPYPVIRSKVGQAAQRLEVCFSVVAGELRKQYGKALGI